VLCVTEALLLGDDQVLGGLAKPGESQYGGGGLSPVIWFKCKSSPPVFHVSDGVASFVPSVQTMR